MPGQNPTVVEDLTEQEIKLKADLTRHIIHLSEEVGERHYLVKGSLKQSADYIRQEFIAAGLKPQNLIYGEHNFEVLWVQLPSTIEKTETIIIGAHYDTVPLTLGADDNASGVAALIELAKFLDRQQLKKHLIFVAFPNEEAPFYGTHLMGSRVFAEAMSDQAIHGMISLEMLAFFSQEKNSQHYPWPFNVFYPDEASFIAFVGNLSSRKWLHDSIYVFRSKASIAAEGLVAPEFLVPDINRSDQVSFWQYDIPAFMITDTANYRSQYYHFAGDVVETLDMDSMTRVVIGIREMLVALANDQMN